MTAVISHARLALAVFLFVIFAVAYSITAEYRDALAAILTGTWAFGACESTLTHSAGAS